MPELFFLDVAHGNSTVVRDGEAVVVVDVPSGALVGDVLIKLGIFAVESVVVSHADRDHVGGVANLLLDDRLEIKNVYVNGDSTKTARGKGRTWEYFARTVSAAEARGNVNVVVGIKRGDPIAFSGATATFEVLAPSVELALLAPGGRDASGKRIGPNTTSVVLRVVAEEEPIALLPGDLDATGLQHLLGCEGDIAAPTLVFPHHGGQSGGDDTDFASEICVAARPETVIFSHGRRSRHVNPLPEIVAGVRATTPEARICCTQLSRHCAEETSPSPFASEPPAKGESTDSCCAGSIVLGDDGELAPGDDEHRAFIAEAVPTPLCMSK